ncbi:putative palmitoyltransferase ZDHHC21 [Astathelohania contejeani]|uniref:Palmitoyltransferase n=1 Tax=Astathelohania contejeani TaxID=164912 RepID=A0ABQ7I0U8_9MICR|nr:putative palmitoyltransferase ZDHHC21 [Thelohania contejeani]
MDEDSPKSYRLMVGFTFHIFIVLILISYSISENVSLHTRIILWILSLISSFSMVKTSLTDPGYINSNAFQVPDEVSSYCSDCGIIKPQYFTHCRYCDICVLECDHHCPWVDNCIGKNNHTYFLIYIISTAVSLCYSLLYFYSLLCETVDWNFPVLGAVAMIWFLMVDGVLTLLFIVLSIYHVVLTIMGIRSREFVKRLMKKKVMCEV